MTVTSALSFGRYRSKSNAKTPRMSVIIAARNEENNLTKLLPLLLSQDYSDFEIIVALDRCDDASKKILENQHSNKLIILEIDTVPDDWNSKKYALDQGIQQSTGEWLVFTDADCEPYSTNWLKSISKAISNETDILIGISPYRSHATFLSQYISYEAFITAFNYISRAIIGKPYMAVGRNMAIRKALFEKSGGYQKIKKITGGDDDLFIQQHASKKNAYVVLGKDSLVITKPEKSWKNYLRQKLRHLAVGSTYKVKDLFFLSSTLISQFLFWVLMPLVTAQFFFLPLLLFYLFIKLVSYRFASSKMEVNINYMLLPLVDMLYALLTPVIAVTSKLVKDIPWKN